MKKTMRKTIPIELTLLILLFVSGCDNNNETQQAQPPVPSVTVTSVKKINIAETVERVAQTHATDEIQFLARVEGFLVERKFIEGSDVKKGELLFVIEKAPYEAEVQKITASLAKAKADHAKALLDLRRAQTLRKKGTISQAELDNASANEKMKAAEINLHRAELRRSRIDLGYTEIRAPIDGRIGRSEFSVGDLVNKQSGPLANLVALDSIYVYWEVSEKIPLSYRQRLDLKEGKPNFKVIPQLRFPDGSFYSQEGRIDFIDNQVNPNTGTQRVRAVFPNPDKVLVPGQYVTLVIQIGESSERLAIPQPAVQANQSGHFVLTIDKNNVANIKPVKMGVRKGVDWVVEAGLIEGEAVIYQGTQKVRPGSKVNPVYKKPSSIQPG